MVPNTIKRRAFLAGSAVSALVLGQRRAQAGTGAGAEDTFVYEVTRSEEEWRGMLDKAEFNILRMGGTELPKTHPLWNNTAEGTYCCRGCDLTLYDSVWKVELDKGWAFFRQSRENTILMGIDGQPPEGMGSDDGRPPAMIEAHCRRCGSHLGHILTVEGETLHCINGTSLQFRDATA